MKPLLGALVFLAAVSVVHSAREDGRRFLDPFISSLRATAADAPFQHLAELVVPYGYPLEQHFVRTEDGYVLRLYRIQHAAHQQPEAGKPVVFLQHGLLDSCAAFVLNGPESGLAFLLADAGYDVWLGNARGNTQSRNHTLLPTTASDFWAFSFDDIARFDVPASLTFIMLKTSAAKVSYVGHSQGTTVLLAMLASQPRWNDLIDIAVLLAPVAFATHVNSLPLLTLAAMDTDAMFTLLGFHEFMPSQNLISKLEGQLCKLRPELCINILAAISGYNYDNINATRLPLYLMYTPAGTSVQNMAHWSQLVRQVSSNTLPWFDWGRDCRVFPGRTAACNQFKYGQDRPLVYNLDAITAPLALFTGGEDRLSDALDYELLLEALPEGTVVYQRLLPKYEHLDFIWGIDAHKVVYAPVLELLGKYAKRAPGPGPAK